jgi:outer membrane protein assembly factor BamB
LHTWVYPLSPAAGTLTSAPVIGADGTVYVTTGTDYVEALSPQGTLVWERAVPGSGSIEAAPALAADQTLRALDYGGNNYVVVPLDGGAITVTPVGPVSEAELNIVSGGTMYYGDTNGYLDARNAHGGVIWSTQAVTSEIAEIAIDTAGEIFTGYSGGYVSGLRSADGAPTWSAPTGQEFVSDLAVATDQTLRGISGDVPSAVEIRRRPQ